MISKASDDIDKKQKIINEELYSIANIVGYINKFEKQVDKKIPAKKEEPKFLSPEAIMQIQIDILGLDF